MTRRSHHEEHINHESWAIPYADLVTLLLAFFVVMYSISSVNEGKYRVVADSMSHAFNGAPKVVEPIQTGLVPSSATRTSVLSAPLPQAGTAPIETPVPQQAPMSRSESEDRLAGIGDHVEEAMAALIDRQLVVVRRHHSRLEVEIRADILFPSGIATLTPQALPPLKLLASIMTGFQNPLHIEGYTDDVPIATAAFPSNWELSAARAASVARLFIDLGVDPHRLAITGLGEFQPETSNATAEGRNKNRRVKLIVLGSAEESDPSGNGAAASAAVAATTPASDSGARETRRVAMRDPVLARAN